MTAAEARNVAMCLLLAPTSEELAAKLPDIGDTLSAACADLARDPRLQGCDLLAAQLHGLSQFTMRLRAALLREVEPTQAA